MKKLGIVAGVGAALAAVLMLAGMAFAQDGGIGVSDGTAAPGETGDVTLDATGVGAPGLGAWTVDITYDNTVITAVDCSPEEGGVCNEAFADNMVRITGASASGLEGDTNLGSITFECADEEASSDLTVSVEVFADATVGAPADLEPSVTNGTFECAVPEPTDEPTAEPAGTPVTAPPATGTGTSTDGNGMTWVIALVAVAGAAVLAVGYGVVRLRP